PPCSSPIRRGRASCTAAASTIAPSISAGPARSRTRGTSRTCWTRSPRGMPLRCARRPPSGASSPSRGDGAARTLADGRGVGAPGPRLRPRADRQGRAVSFRTFARGGDDHLQPPHRAHRPPQLRALPSPGRGRPLQPADVRGRAEQVARVTQIRFMPPWPPEPGYGDLAGSRRLTDAEVALIQRWVAEGTPEGPPSTPPSPPAFTEGWQL